MCFYKAAECCVGDLFDICMLFSGILCYSRLFLKADVSLLPKNAFLFISYSLKRLVLLHRVTSLLENAQQPEISSRPELGSQAARMRGAGTLYCIMRHDLSIISH